MFAKAVPGAGHHVYADKPQIFNQWVNDACTMADTDEHLKIKPSNGTSSPKIQSESEENGEIALDAKPLPLTDDVHWGSLLYGLFYLYKHFCNLLYIILYCWYL